MEREERHSEVRDGKERKNERNKQTNGHNVERGNVADRERETERDFTPYMVIVVMWFGRAVNSSRDNLML